MKIKSIGMILDKDKTDKTTTKQIKKYLKELAALTGKNSKADKLIKKIKKAYNMERNYLIRRAEITEDLASIGLSVEAASHDIVATIGRASGHMEAHIKHLKDTRKTLYIPTAVNNLEIIQEEIDFVASRISDIQPVFTTRLFRKNNIRVEEIATKTEKMFHSILEKDKIELSLEEIGKPLLANTVDNVLYQAFMNLMDNAICSLREGPEENRKIKIVLLGDTKQMVFADNGPGIPTANIPYIFQTFYSTRGKEAGGRSGSKGLGLYIVRQILERNGFSISLIEKDSEKHLPGANFLIDFNPASHAKPDMI